MGGHLDFQPDFLFSVSFFVPYLPSPSIVLLVFLSLSLPPPLVLPEFGSQWLLVLRPTLWTLMSLGLV
jgi:hypothetical protein